MLVDELDFPILILSAISRSNRQGIEVGLRRVTVAVQLTGVRIQVELKLLGVVCWVVIELVAVRFTSTILQDELLDLQQVVPSYDLFIILHLRNTQSNVHVPRQRHSRAREDGKE